MMNADARKARRLLAGGALLVLAVLAAPGVQAQDEDEEVETYTVTGSRIQSDEPLSVSPITQIDADELLFQGNARVEDMLRSYPQVYIAQGSGDSNGAVGTATVELRALGPRRTLVLVNGRRLPTGSAFQAGIADINQIPGAMIERVDILTGGASAAYGSDAVAGVINFILMDDFEGLSADFQYSEYQHHNDGERWHEVIRASGEEPATGYVSDGDIARASLIGGLNFADGRGNVTAYATYRNIEPVLHGARDYSSCALSPRLDECFGSSTIPEGRFTDFSLASLFEGVGDFVGGEAFDYIVEDHAFVDRNDLTYNYGPANYYQRSDERYTLGMFARYEFSDAAEVYSELMYAHDRTTSQIAPSGSFFHTSTLNCAHPLMSDAQRLGIGCLDAQGNVIDGQQIVFIGRRNVEGGPRREAIRHASYRGVLGLHGELGDSWDYDAHVQYARVALSHRYQNDMSVSRLHRALDAVEHNGEAVCRSALPDENGVIEDPDCVPWNIFQTGGVTPEMVDYLNIPLYGNGTTDQIVASTTFSGELDGIALPYADNDVSVAFGAEFRKESLDYNPDENYQSGDGTGQGGATVAISGHYKVAEYFGEAHIPIIEDIDFVEELTLDAAYRYSNYDYGGSIDTWAFRLGWTVNPVIRFRGGVQRAVRAPNVQELFLPQRFSLFMSQADPCAGNTGGTVNPDGSITGGLSGEGYSFEQCQRSGVTAQQWGKIENSPAGQYNRKSGGNPELVPEEAKTWTAGFVFTPVDALTLAMDYYKVEVERGIAGLSAGFILYECVRGTQPELCDRIVRGVAGDLWVGSNVEGVRCTGTETDLSRCISGHVVSVQDNLAIERVEGVDITADLTVDLGARGELNFSNVLTHINSLSQQAVEGAPITRCEGTRYCGPTPDLQNRLRVTWDLPWGLTTSLMWRYIRGVKPGSHPVGLGKRSYFDFAAVWQITDDAKIYAGINNLTDLEPPIVGTASGENGNTFTGLYDALGRYLFVGASMEF